MGHVRPRAQHGVHPQPLLEVRHRLGILAAAEIKFPDHACDGTPVEHRSRAESRGAPVHGGEHLPQGPAPVRIVQPPGE